jgi:hypothetical protein
MTDDLKGPEPSRSPATRGRRFKPHSLALANGAKLTLSADGSIDHVDGQGATIHSWTPDDPEWANQAFRFGLHPQAPTVAPQGPVQGTKPPKQ